MAHAFPRSPLYAQRYFDTDTFLEYAWDGTRWLSLNEYVLNIPGTTLAATTTVSFFTPDYHLTKSGGNTSVWLEYGTITHQESILQSGINFWTVKLTDNAGTTIGPTFNTGARPDLAATTYLDTMAFNAVRGIGSDARWQLVLTLAGAAQNIQLGYTLTYRLIGRDL